VNLGWPSALDDHCNQEDHAMRSITAIAACALTAAPLVAFGPPAHADNDFVGQAQRFFNNGDNDRNSYERGRDDEIRRQQAERDRDRYARDRDNRYVNPNYGYRDQGYGNGYR
jgi:hypothetical protein